MKKQIILGLMALGAISANVQAFRWDTVNRGPVSASHEVSQAAKKTQLVADITQISLQLASLHTAASLAASKGNTAQAASLNYKIAALNRELNAKKAQLAKW